jgi:hypothetical protein
MHISTLRRPTEPVPVPNGMTVHTLSDGTIVSASDTAAHLLNLSARGLAGRRIHLFVAGARERIDDSLNRLARGTDTWDLDIVLRPRDKKPLPVRIIIERDNETDLLVWRISRADESVPAATA